MSADQTVPGALISDPIGTLVDETRRLHTIQDSEFAREWLLRALKVELHRYSMEDALIDTRSEIFKGAVAAFEELSGNTDWIDPLLERYLIAVRRAAQLPQLPYEVKARSVRIDDREVKIRERETREPYSFWVSNTSATRVAIIEESLGRPVECESVLAAFAYRLNQLKDQYHLTRLCFIEKEMGPVGAISMLSSLVLATGLPACIYRETHWTREMSLAADRPQPSDRMAIVYDLVVTGAGIIGAADIVKELSGATTVAAMVLCGYGAKRELLITPQQQHIALGALDWRTDVHGPAFEYVPSHGEHEARKKGSEPRKQPGDKAMGKKRSGTRAIPPGFYNRQSLPTISRAAQSIVDRVYAASSADASVAGGTSRTTGPIKLKGTSAGAIRLKRAPE